MRTNEIPRKQWGSKLDEFSRMHDGWLVSLDIRAANALTTQREFRLMPLVGITAEPGSGGTISIAVAEATGDQVTHIIHSPTHVFFDKTNKGADAALEIDSADGMTAFLRVRTTQ